MNKSYAKDVASHPAPESCVCIGNDTGEALTGANAGQVLNCEVSLTGAPTLLTEVEGHTSRVVLARLVWASRSRRPRKRWRSTAETAEQLGTAHRCRGGVRKAIDQGTRGANCHSPDSETDRRVDCLTPCARSDPPHVFAFSPNTQGRSRMQ